MWNINSKYQTEIDISKMKNDAVAKITLHRNSYQAVESALQNKLAISLLYDKRKSDEYIASSGFDIATDIMLQLEIIGINGSSKTQL